MDIEQNRKKDWDIMKAEKGLNILARMLLILFVISATILPVLTTDSNQPELDGYYSKFILHNAIAVIFMVVVLIRALFRKKFKKNFIVGVCLLTLAFIAYNVLYYQNMDVIQFPWAQYNTSISLGVLIVLMVTETKTIFWDDRLIKMIIAIILITNMIGLYVYYQGYISMHMYNFKIFFHPFDFNVFHEKRYNWIYFYKCQYSCILLLFVAFFVTHKDKFWNKILYIICLAVLFWCLYIAHTNTSTICAAMIVVADCIDEVIKDKKFLIIKIIGLIVVVVGVIKYGFKYFLDWLSGERDLSTIGYRKPIWEAAIQKIKENPQGIGMNFALNRQEWLQFNGLSTNNCHNIFLNEMLRFSIPVGCSYAAFFLLTCVYSLFKKFSFCRLAIWVAFFVAVSMDYSIQTPELSMVMFMFYCIFFYPLEEE